MPQIQAPCALTEAILKKLLTDFTVPTDNGRQQLRWMVAHWVVNHFVGCRDGGTAHEDLTQFRGEDSFDVDTSMGLFAMVEENQTREAMEVDTTGLDATPDRLAVCHPPLTDQQVEASVRNTSSIPWLPVEISFQNMRLVKKYFRMDCEHRQLEIARVKANTELVQVEGTFKLRMVELDVERERIIAEQERSCTSLPGSERERIQTMQERALSPKPCLNGRRCLKKREYWQVWSDCELKNSNFFIRCPRNR